MVAIRVNPLNFFINSPNFVWFLVALADYLICPYNLEKAKVWSADWVIYRCAVNVFIMLTYFGFWSLTLYSLGYGKRKFNTEHVASVSRMFREFTTSLPWLVTYGLMLTDCVCVYTYRQRLVLRPRCQYVPKQPAFAWDSWIICSDSLLVFAVQLGLWEALFMNCYATGKLDYIKNEEAFSTPENIFRMVFFTLAIPLYRSVHFYFAHRFIHIRALYKYVHSLHHRNTDIEPFSGLCMHPIEHLYYYSCVGVGSQAIPRPAWFFPGSFLRDCWCFQPSLVFKMSPFHTMWHLIHLLISPAASHSGWENCMQADQFHYLHHRKFECNYGTSGEPLDRWFGTYRGSLDPKDNDYKGGASEKELDKEFSEVRLILT